MFKLKLRHSPVSDNTGTVFVLDEHEFGSVESAAIICRFVGEHPELAVRGMDGTHYCAIAEALTRGERDGTYFYPIGDEVTRVEWELVGSESKSRYRH